MSTRGLVDTIFGKECLGGGGCYGAEADLFDGGGG
jgi:hypothetical protein